MTATSFLLLLVVPAILFALFWRIDRNFADPDPADDGGTDKSDDDLVVTQVAAAERLRRQAAVTSDPEEKASLTRLADEADADAEKLKKEFE